MQDIASSSLPSGINLERSSRIPRTLSLPRWILLLTSLRISKSRYVYRVTRRVFSKSVISKLHLLFKKNLAGYLKTLKVTRISAMYTNFSHPPVHSGPSKFSRPKI